MPITLAVDAENTTSPNGEIRDREQPRADDVDDAETNDASDTAPADGASRETAGADPNASDESESTAASSTRSEAKDPDQSRRRLPWRAVLAYGLLPSLVLLLGVGAAYLKWLDGVARDTQLARIQSVQAATESTVALLSYRPETVDRDLHSASDRLTGAFRESYTSLINDVVIPGSKQKKISAVATVPAAASVSASATHAVVLVFVDQTTTIGDGAPTNNASSVRVSLDKVGERWLMSDFTPV